MWSILFQSTSNYHARRFGVRAAMPGFIAKRLCPHLIIVPLNFDKYRVVSKQVGICLAPTSICSWVSCRIRSQLQMPRHSGIWPPLILLAAASAISSASLISPGLFTSPGAYILFSKKRKYFPSIFHLLRKVISQNFGKLSL